MSYELRAMLNAYHRESEETVKDADLIALTSITPNTAAIDVLGSASSLGRVAAYNLVTDPAGLGTQAAWTKGSGGFSAGTLQARDDLSPPAPWTRAMANVSAGTGQPIGLRVAALALDSLEAQPKLTAPATLPTATLTLDSTAILPPSGTVYVAGQLVTYTGRTSTTLTGCTGGTGAVAVGAPVSEMLETCWWYALVSSDIPFKVALAQPFSPYSRYGEVTLGATAGWLLVGGAAQLQPGAAYEILIESQSSSPAAGTKVAMTGATVAQGADPGGPFSGGNPARSDAATTEVPQRKSVHFAWDGAAQGSRSRMHTTTLDVIALREAEAGLDINPVGLSDAQRALYLLKRRQARHNGGASSLVDLIVALIQTEDPTFTASRVKIVRDYGNRTFSVQIVNYNTTRVLAERVERMINSLRPLAMNFVGVSIGWPIAELEAAFAGGDIADVEATYTSIDNAESNTA